MRLSCITDEISQDLGHALGVMSEYGITEAELRNVYGTYIVDADEAVLRRVENDLSRHAMRVCCIDTPLYKCDLDEGNSSATGATHGAGDRTHSQQLALLQHSIDLCRRFDTNLIRIFSFWRRGPLTPALEDRIAEALARPCQLAERAGVVLLLENEHSCTLGTGAETARMVERIGSPALRMLWDPGNAYMAGETPFPAGWAASAPHVAHVHVKDARAGDAPVPEWTCVGEGDIDYRGQFGSLRASGYAGAIALETHWRGAGGDPEASSRACLAALRRLVDEA